MEQHFVDTAKCSACYPYLKKARSAPAPHVHGTVACQVDGIFICAIELPSHCNGIALEKLIRDCWAKVEWGYRRILVRDRANAGWIDYMLKDRQKSEFDGFVDCVIIESLHNPIADA